MKVTTSQRLKQLMSDRGLKQVDILEQSKSYQKELDIKMSKSSLSEYVSGASNPDQNKLLLLGRTLNVSEAWLMGYDVPMERTVNNITGDNNTTVSDSEQVFTGDISGTVTITNSDTSEVEKGQELSLESSNALLRIQKIGGDVRSEILEVLKDIKKDQRKLIAEVKRLNTSSEAHIEPVSDFSEADEELYPYQVYERLSAGTGSAVWDDGSYDTVYFDEELNHDIASWVWGDSMEPTYLNGEVALIRETGYDYDGAVYAVVWDGRTYIKRVYKEEDGLRLESLNPKYRDLFAPFEEEPRVVGLVVGHFMPMEK